VVIAPMAMVVLLARYFPPLKAGYNQLDEDVGIGLCLAVIGRAVESLIDRLVGSDCKAGFC
jgi:hypothetical protein